MQIPCSRKYISAYEDLEEGQSDFIPKTEGKCSVGEAGQGSHQVLQLTLTVWNIKGSGYTFGGGSQIKGGLQKPHG